MELQISYPDNGTSLPPFATIVLKHHAEKGNARLILKADTNLHFGKELKEVYHSIQIPSWNFICLNEDTNTKTRSLLLNGERIAYTPLKGNKDGMSSWQSDKLVLQINNVVGRIGNIKIFGKETDLSSIDCKTQGTFLDWKFQTWTNVQKRRQISFDEVCNKVSSARLYIQIAGKGAIHAFHAAKEVCKNSGFGKIPSVKTKADKEAIFEVNPATQQAQEQWYWADLDGAENPEDDFNGIELNLNQTGCNVCNFGGCKGFDCNSEAIVICEFSAYHNLTLQGLCRTSKIDRLYYPFFYKQIFWVGHSDGLIFQLNDGSRKWQFSQLTGNAYAVSKYGTDNVLGANRWQIYRDEKCPKTSSEGQMLHLNLCNGSQFNCGDGSCIDMEYRCDARSDCPDKTDEKSCSLIDNLGDYNAEIISSNSAKRDSKLALSIEMKLKSFLDIDENNGLFRTNFITKLIWFDRRLKFFNLKENNLANTLIIEESKAIWKPKLTFVNSEVWRHEFNMGPIEHINMHEKHAYTTAGAEYLNNGRIFNGDRNNLSQIMEIRLGYVKK